MSPTLTITTKSKSTTVVNDTGKCAVRIGKINLISDIHRSQDKSMTASHDEIRSFVERFGDMSLDAVITRWPRAKGMGLRYSYPTLPMSIIHVLTDAHAIVNKRIVNRLLKMPLGPNQHGGLHCSPPPADFGSSFKLTEVRTIMVPVGKLTDYLPADMKLSIADLKRILPCETMVQLKVSI
jgi:hypothetical protein